MKWERSMSDDSSNLAALRAANSPNSFDLRRVGAHPDYWYPVAWSEELKVGKTLGSRFASLPLALYRGTSGQVFASEDRCAHRQVPVHLRVVRGAAPTCHITGRSYNHPD